MMNATQRAAIDAGAAPRGETVARGDAGYLRDALATDRLDDETRDDALAIASEYVEPATVATEDEAVAYLSRDGGQVPCSRYGHDAASCAPVAWAAAVIVARETEGGDPTTEELEHMMGLVVNDHDDPETLVREHGPAHGIDPADYLEGEDPAYDAYREHVGAEYAAETFEDAYAGEWSNLREYVEELAGELGWFAALEASGINPAYLDVAAFARDLELGGDYWTAPAGPGRVHVFRAA